MKIGIFFVIVFFQTFFQSKNKTKISRKSLHIKRKKIE
jgi:hypothetical protein